MWSKMKNCKACHRAITDEFDFCSRLCKTHYNYLVEVKEKGAFPTVYCSECEEEIPYNETTCSKHSKTIPFTEKDVMRVVVGDLVYFDSEEYHIYAIWRDLNAIVIERFSNNVWVRRVVSKADDSFNLLKRKDNGTNNQNQ
jgi:hypothetical protein